MPDHPPRALDRAELLTIGQADEQYPAIGARYFRRLIAERRIPTVRLGRRVFLDRADIEAYIDSGRTAAVRGDGA